MGSSHTVVINPTRIISHLVHTADRTTSTQHSMEVAAIHRSSHLMAHLLTSRATVLPHLVDSLGDSLVDISPAMELHQDNTSQAMGPLPEDNINRITVVQRRVAIRRTSRKANSHHNSLLLRDSSTNNTPRLPDSNSSILLRPDNTSNILLRPVELRSSIHPPPAAVVTTRHMVLRVVSSHMASNLTSQVLLTNMALLLCPMAATRATEDTVVVTKKPLRLFSH